MSPGFIFQASSSVLVTPTKQAQRQTKETGGGSPQHLNLQAHPARCRGRAHSAEAPSDPCPPKESEGQWGRLVTRHATYNEAAGGNAKCHSELPVA